MRDLKAEYVMARTKEILIPASVATTKERQAIVAFINADPVKLTALQTRVKADKITGTQVQKPKTTI